ncbi:MAG TPA: hypothetical protein PKD26_12295 [Pyrinomonadaceae bacterium]|nr:hypothetical protein [Pyrinomonadaceae bacterium]
MNPDFKDLLQAFNDERVKYMIIGGYAVIKHTEPRFTKDLDLWVSPERGNAEKVYAALVKFGAPVTDLSPDDFTEHDFFFTMGIAPNRIGLLFDLKGVESEEAWRRGVKGKLGDLEVVFIGREDLIKNKEAAGRLQDLADAEKLRETSQDDQ